MLVNQFECQYEPHAVALSHKCPLKTLHHTALNADFFADNKVAIRFDPLPAEARAQKLDLGIRKRDTLSAVAHDLQHTGRLENLRRSLELMCTNR